MVSVVELRKRREALKKANPNHKWATKVNLMTPEEVNVAYLRLKSQNKL